ncbi:hypothetical protein WD019_12805 [Fictibacillus sp. Mic-4]|uniref:hypothetical protein n=1 Tax=Fictibacillus sp. Mic-4 TaxID=3132826 RepID=UPI003CED8C2D
MIKRVIAIGIPAMIFCLSMIANKSNTYAWFHSETKASGELRNATTNDLLLIEKGDVSYNRSCSIRQKLSIKNISHMPIPITFENQHKTLAPGAALKANIDRKVSCKAVEVRYKLVGFNHYIDEMIYVPLDKEKLLATVEKKKEKMIPQSGRFHKQEDVLQPADESDSKEQKSVPKKEDASTGSDKKKVLETEPKQKSSIKRGKEEDK